MRTQNVKNRITAVLLCVAMILSMIPGGIGDLFAVRAEAANSLSLSANQLAFGANVIPASLTSNATFMDTYVKTNGSSMNLNSLFKKVGSDNADNASDTLSNSKIDGTKNDLWYVEYRWTPAAEERALLAASRFTLVYEGKLTPDWDTHLLSSDHWSNASIRLVKGDWVYKQNDYGYKTNGEIIFGAITTEKNSGTAQAVMKSENSISLDEGEFLTFAAYKSWARSCGDPSVNDSAFYFTENSNPYIKNLYIEGGSYINFDGKESVEGTLVMEFSEDVRLADNDADGKGLTVDLDAYYRSGSKAGTALTGNNKITAGLVSISGNTMRFKFTVPAKLNGSNTDIQITGLSSNQSELWSICDLNVYKADGTLFKTVTDGSASAITDIAGNPLSAYSGKISTVIYDNVSPTVSRIDMTGPMITADSTKEPSSWDDNSVDMSAVFAGEGDTVGFKMFFSENITNANAVMAVLSITDSSGDPIKLGVKSVSGNCITFNNVTITKEMLKAGSRICISSIENISNITDRAGNKLVDGSGNSSASAKFSLNYPSLHAHQIYLDVDSPIITIGDAIADANGGEYFTVPITIAEKTGADRVSTVDDVPFSFVLSASGSNVREGYYWYIDGNQASQTYSYSSGKWNTATVGSTKCSFSTTSDSYQYYLHIYLDPSTNYGYTSSGGMDEEGVYFNGSITVTAGDWAGNTAEASRTLSHQVDTVAPNAAGTDGFTKNPTLSVDFSNSNAAVTSSFRLTDNYCLEGVTYRWYTRYGSETGYTAGTPVTLSASDLGKGLVKEFSKTVTLDWTFDSAEKRSGDVYLEVIYEDRPGHSVTIKSEPLSFNFTKAAGNYKITTGEEDKPILQPFIELSAPTTTATDLENIPRTLIFIPVLTSASGASYFVYDPWDWDGEYDASLPQGSYGTGALKYTADDLIQLLFTYYEEICDSEENFQTMTDYFPGRFYTMTGTIENNAGTFSGGYNVCEAPDDCRELYEYIKNCYGTMEVLFVTTASLEQWLDDYSNVSPAAFASDFNFKASESTVESYTLYLANSITYNVETLAVTDSKSNDLSGLLKYEKGSATAASLDNVCITFQLSNVSDASANYQYGFQTIDFENSKVELLYGDTEVLASWDLARADEQRVILEPGLCQQMGWYHLRVTVRDNLTGEDQVFDLDEYFLDTASSELSLDTYYKKYESEDEAVRIDSEFGVNKTGLEAIYAESGEVILMGLDTAPEGWTLETYFEFSRTKNSDYSTYGVGDISRIQVTNLTYDKACKAALEAQGLTYDPDKLSGQWISSANTYAFRYIPVWTDAFTEGAYDNMVIPMLEGENVLTYKLENVNGTCSEKMVVFHVYGSSLDWKLDYTLESRNEGYVNSVTVTAGLPDDSTFALDDCRFSYNTSTNYLFPTSYTFTDDLDTTEFILFDPYGNLSTRKFGVTDENGDLIDIDGTPSTVSVYGKQGLNTGYDDSGTFCLEVTVKDIERQISPDDLVLTFDSYYSAVLGGIEVGARHLNTEQVSVSIPFALNGDGTFAQNEDGTYPVWESYNLANRGIYRTQVLQVGGEEGYAGYVRFFLWGTWKYDAELETDENKPSDRIVTVSSQDPYGNVGSDSWSYGYSNPDVRLGNGTPVEIMHEMFDPYGSYTDREAYAGQLNLDAKLTQDQQLGIYSTVPLLSIEGYGAGRPTQYLTVGQAQRVFSTTAPMIIEDGTYYLTGTDLFGQTFELELWVYDTFGELGITALFSTVEPTNEDVTVTVQATGLQDKIVSVTSSLGTVGTIDPADPRAASITVSENCSVTVVTEDGCERTLGVSNIDKDLGEAYIVYYDASANVMTGAETQAWDEVTALLACDSEYIYATNGPDEYTFLPGDKAGDTYTFEYRDAAGNTGSITAVLPCDVVASPVPDTTAPSFKLNMFAMRSRVYTLLAETKNPETGAEISPEIDGYKAQRFKFVLTIEDASAIKVIVQPTGQAAPSDYASVETGSTVENVSLSVSGRTATLQITENTRFDIYIIDAFDNLTALTDVVINSVDTEAPELYADYEVFTDPEGLSGVSVRFLPMDPTEQLEILTPLSTGAIAWLDYVMGEDGETLVPITRYGYIFNDNGSFTFTYQDEYGNIGSVAAQVQGLSNAAAVVKSVSWYGTKGNTTPEKSAIVNKDVVAQLDMSKAISWVSLYKYDAAAENNLGEPVNDANVSVSFTGTNVFVTYTGNVEYQMVAEFTAAESGRRGYYTLQAVNCIDKRSPVVTVKSTELTENRRAMIVTFETDKDTLLSQNTAEGYTQVHTYIVKTNAPQQLQFSDSVGNITVYELTENASVDTQYLSVLYSITGSDEDATDEPLDLELDSEETIYIKTNKAADAELAGEAVGSVAANVWTALTVPENAGIHILALTDINTGEVLYDVLSSVPKDNVPPVIALTSSTVIVNEDASYEDMLAAIQSGVTVTDDKDGAITAYRVTGYPNKVTAGLYTLTYHVSDEAGNSSVTTRALYIMAEGTPLLLVNGEAALPYGKVDISSGENITLQMQNFDGDLDGVVIKYHSGIKTAGQMKYYAVTVEDMSFSVTEPGHYTIYIRTQDRVEYVTYIYVEG